MVKNWITMKYIIYLTVNNKSKKNGLNKIYIGYHKTEDPEIFDGYLGCGVYVQKPATYMQPTTPFQKAVKKYGPNAFTRYTIQIVDTIEEASAIEESIVTEQFIRQAHVYNVAVGGLGGYFKGQQDRTWHSKPINQFDYDGNLIKTWNSTVEAADSLGLNLIRLQRASTDGITYAGFYWSRQPQIFNTNHRKQKTFVYTKDGSQVAVFGTRKECAQYLGCTPQAVSHACRNQQLLCNHYVSNINTDEFKPKPRVQLKSCQFFLYSIPYRFIGTFVGKEIFKQLKVFSFAKLDKIIHDNDGWFKNFYISTKQITELPSRKLNPVTLKVYDKNGTLIEEFNTFKECRVKYGLTHTQMNKVINQITECNGYVFKYSK